MKKIKNRSLCRFLLAVCLLGPTLPLAGGADISIDLTSIERDRVISQADDFLKQQPVTVTDSVCDRSQGGKHDFYSEGDYWWPNPKDANGPYIHRDGMTNPQNFVAHRQAMRRFSIHTATLAAAFKITSKNQYAEHAINHLRAWFIDEATRMNPNLNYSQAIKGICPGRPTGVIDGIHMVEVARAVSVLEDLDAVSDDDLRGIKKWFADYLTWLTTSKFAIEERDTTNNHATCWLMQAAEFARLVDDRQTTEYCRDRFRTVILPGQLDKDGRFPKEINRTKPYGYSLFNLDAMAAICHILSTKTDDLWAFTLPDGRTFKQAIDFMCPYIKDKSSWPYRQDVMYFDEWPVRHPALLFAGIAFGEQKYIDLWKTLPPIPKTPEGIRNFPIRQPILWTNSCNFTDWQFTAARQEIAAKHYQNDKLTYHGLPTLAISGDGKDFAEGKWTSVADVLPDNWYRFTVKYLADKVQEPRRCIMARILWLDNGGNQISSTEYPATLGRQSLQKWNAIQQSYKSPENAAQVKIELIYHWDPDGTVNFACPTLDRITQPEPRMVGLAAVHYCPQKDRTIEQNFNHFAELITQAAGKGADIVCLPEAITMVSTGKKPHEAAEIVPGPTTDFLGSVAAKNKLYIVAGIYERSGPAIYNTAILLDRKGRLAGKYRKVSLPREEIDEAVTPGDSLNVFDTDFGRIGIMVCWDVFFPEPARVMALKGAEVILMPIWGGNLTLAKARAIENQIYLVTSCYNTKTMKTAVFDRDGTILAEADNDNPVIVVEVDLNDRKLWPWLGDFRNRIPREMPSRKAIWDENIF